MYALIWKLYCFKLCRQVLCGILFFFSILLKCNKLEKHTHIIIWPFRRCSVQTNNIHSVKMFCFSYKSEFIIFYLFAYLLILKLTISLTQFLQKKKKKSIQSNNSKSSHAVAVILFFFSVFLRHEGSVRRFSSSCCLLYV